jgi:hypothetical protein
MIIIPDTNIFFNDWDLKRTTIRILLEFAPKAGFEIIFQEIVIMELVNQVREAIVSVANANNERLTDLYQKTGTRISFFIIEDEIEKEVGKYEEFLRKRLEKLETKTARIPDISHKTILERDLERRKPFSKDGKGYRDALIWQTILETAKEQKDKIVFITQNTKDFADDDKKGFHDDLVQDIRDLKFDPSKITLSPSLSLFLKDNLIPCLPSPEQTLVNFMQKTHPTFKLEDELAETLSEELIGEEIEYHSIGKPSEYESITFSMVEAAYDINIIDEHELSPTERVIDLEAYLDCEFNAFIFKSDLWCMNEDEMPFVSNPDWNKNYAAVSFSETVLAQLYITLDMEKGEISSIEIVDIQGVHSEY